MKKQGAINCAKTTKKTRNYFFVVVALVIAQALFISCMSSPNTSSTTIRSDDIRDYVCIVNRYLHPNMERYIKSRQIELMSEGNEESDNYASDLEAIRRGGFGSGFVYVDSRGNNYVITNYHVIVGAYRLSVTFENENLEQTRFLNLSVLYADEEADVAVLAFPEGERPFNQGIPLSSAAIRSGADVNAAGFPGMYNQPVWSFSRGSIVNPHVTPPGMADWYIQHSSEIHPGNSGGPLLVADRNSPLGYSVAGINTFYISRGAGNSYFAIPNEKINSILQEAFTQKDERTALEERVNTFMDLLRLASDNMVYERLFPFLSSSMVSLDPIGSAEKLPEVMTQIADQLNEDPVIGIGWTVAYNEIENYLYKRTQEVEPEVVSIVDNNFGGYTVNFIISGYPYKTEWVKDYGTWKLDDFTEDDGEYNDYSDFATPHLLGKKTIFSFASIRDFDWYVLEVPKNGRLTVWTEGNADPALAVYYDPATEESRARTLIGENDDSSSSSYNARVSANVRAGKVYVQVILAGGSSEPEYTLCTQLE